MSTRTIRTVLQSMKVIGGGIDDLEAIERDLDRAVVEPKFHTDQSGETACRIHVLNRRISTKQEL